MVQHQEVFQGCQVRLSCVGGRQQKKTAKKTVKRYRGKEQQIVSCIVRDEERRRKREALYDYLLGSLTNKANCRQKDYKKDSKKELGKTAKLT